MATVTESAMANYPASALLAMVLPLVVPYPDDPLEEFGERFDAQRAAVELAARATIHEGDGRRSR